LLAFALRLPLLHRGWAAWLVPGVCGMPGPRASGGRCRKGRAHHWRIATPWRHGASEASEHCHPRGSGACDCASEAPVTRAPARSCCCWISAPGTRPPRPCQAVRPHPCTPTSCPPRPVPKAASALHVGGQQACPGRSRLPAPHPSPSPILWPHANVGASHRLTDPHVQPCAEGEAQPSLAGMVGWGRAIDGTSIRIPRSTSSCTRCAYASLVVCTLACRSAFRVSSTFPVTRRSRVANMCLRACGVVRVAVPARCSGYEEQTRD